MYYEQFYVSGVQSKDPNKNNQKSESQYRCRVVTATRREKRDGRGKGAFSSSIWHGQGKHEIEREARPPTKLPALCTASPRLPTQI